MESDDLRVDFDDLMRVEIGDLRVDFDDLMRVESDDLRVDCDGPRAGRHGLAL